MKRQRIKTEIREKEETIEKKLTNLEIIKLHEKDFILMIMKMIQDFGNELEAKNEKLQETLNKQI
mgnify:CR=1 FL=1